jgi:hypothetical protein
MIKKMAPLVAIAAAAGVAVTVAQASASHAVNLKGDGSGIYHGPIVGPANTSVFGGTLGTNGAIIEKQVAKTMSMGVTTTFGGSVTVFGPKGSYSGTITAGTQTPSKGNGPPPQSTATVKVTAGAGLYKGATGSVTVTNTLIPGSPGTYKIVVTGSIKY